MLELKTKNGYIVTIQEILTDFDVFIGVEYASFTVRNRLGSEPAEIPRMDITVSFYDRWGNFIGNTFNPQAIVPFSTSRNSLVLPEGKDLYNLIQEQDEKELQQ